MDSTNQKDKPKGNAASQRQRFIDTAKDIGADETGEAFEKAFGKIVPPKAHASDCAVHNGPAKKAGPCDCGLIPFSERER
jgi:hypothetical protein